MAARARVTLTLQGINSLQGISAAMEPCKQAENHLYVELVINLYAYMVGRRVRSLSTAISRGRDWLDLVGLPYNPVGCGNNKTNLAGTYRPIPTTCPSSCPWLAGGECYGMQGHCAVAVRRASNDTEASVNAALVAMLGHVIAKVYCPMRHGVTGDIVLQGNTLDRPYLHGLQRGIAAIQSLGLPWPSGVPRVYGYTAATHDVVDDNTLSALMDTGIMLRRSNTRPQPGGMHPFCAMVGTPPTQYIDDNNGYTLFHCPAQRRGMSCRNCGWCWTRMGTVIFEPHGAKARRMFR